MFNFAINEDLISINQYPFRKYSFKKPITNKNYLNEDQFQELLNYDVSKLKQNEINYDMFVFACYAGGLRFSDVVELKWIDFLPNEQYIVKVIQKTKRKHQFKLPQKAVSIIEKYRRNEYKSTDFIFPLLKDDFDYSKTQEYLFKDTAKYNTLTNQTLNKIGKELKLPFPLTFHTSRHTFATRALNKGMRIEHVSKILDHTNISITQIYAKIINKELDKAMDIMDE
jgi:site-specific recombinase XerD